MCMHICAIMDEKRFKLIEVAKAYFLESHTQAEIAQQLGISRSQVSRYLTEARDQGIVQIRIIDETSQTSDINQVLEKRYPHLKHILITPIFEQAPEIIRANIGRYAANFLVETLQPGQQVTLGCGRTLEAMVRALPERKITGISVIQAMGNLGHEAHKIDYNEIARVAAEKLGGKVHYLSAPAILGIGSGSAKEFLRTNPMLADALAIANEADIFLFGIGSIESDLVYTRFGLIQEHELQELKGKVVGDICGRFFDIHGHEISSAFEQRLIGINLKSIRDAKYAIALAGGADKAAPLLGAIRGKWINGLISDEQTVHSILALDDAYPIMTES